RHGHMQGKLIVGEQSLNQRGFAAAAGTGQNDKRSLPVSAPFSLGPFAGHWKPEGPSPYRTKDEITRRFERAPESSRERLLSPQHAAKSRRRLLLSRSCLLRETSLG